MSEKIERHHLERKAILYVRQLTIRRLQVLHNRESSALQYAMRDRLGQLGWSQVETIRSMTTLAGRHRVVRTAPASTAWSPKSALAKSELWLRASIPLRPQQP